MLICCVFYDAQCLLMRPRSTIAVLDSSANLQNSRLSCGRQMRVSPTDMPTTRVRPLGLCSSVVSTCACSYILLLLPWLICITLCSWVKDHRQVYLIGNPVVWWSAALSVVAYVAVRGLLILRGQRGFNDFKNCESLGDLLLSTVHVLIYAI